MTGAKMKKLLILFLLLGIVKADDPKCAVSCYNQGGGVAVFVAGKEYTFEYEGKVSSVSNVMGPNESLMSIFMKVIISANTPCDLKMKVEMEEGASADSEGVEAMNDEDAKWFTDSLQLHDLHFSYQAGRVDHLCPHQDEDPVVTNFKRGILSTLQFSITDITPDSVVIIDEEDVSGWCETEYSADSESVLIKKKNGCHSNSHLPFIPYTHYNTKSSHQAPIFRSHQTCELHHTSGELSMAECTEEIQVSTSLASFVGNSSTLDPFSLAHISVSTSLKKQGVEDMPEGNFSEAGHTWKQAPLSADIFGAEMSEKKRKQIDADVMPQIEETLQTLEESLDIDSELVEQRPHLFSHLVHLMNQLEVTAAEGDEEGDEEEEEEEEEENKEGQLETIWKSLEDKKVQKNFFLDALLMCEGSQCVRLMAGLTTDLLISDDSDDIGISRDRIDAWFMTLHLQHSPRVESVKILMGMDNELEVHGKAKLAASTMLYKICHDNPDQCHNISKLFLDNVNQEINNWCTRELRPRPGAQSGLEDNFLEVLRALGNAGVSPDEAQPEICYMNKGLKSEKRILALQSYRRIGCPATEAPWKILEDKEDDEEIRIAAYLALIPCATKMPDFFTRLKHLLDQEQNLQVGSFIWSHVRNLIDNPGIGDNEQQLSRLAQQYSLPSRFAATAEDFRTSRNRRFAKFSELLNFGGSLESNMIFTPASFMPTQANMNFSLNLFDTTFNPLEIGGDFRGLENLLQRLFGKDGMFGNEKILGLLMPDGKVPNDMQAEDFGSGVFEPNIIRDEKIQEFQSLYDEGRESSEDEGSKASVYLRVFGHEIVYIRDILKFANPDAIFSYLKNLLLGSKSFQIMDQEYIRSTLLGFPLHLKLNSTGSINFDHEFKATRDRTGKTTFEASINPSIVVSADETLWVNGYVSASGLRRSSTHSARTQFAGRITLDSQGGQAAEVHIKVPSDDLTKISSNVKVSIYDNTQNIWKDHEASAESMDEREYCTPDQFNNAIGIKMCGSIAHGVYEQDGEPIAGEPYKTEFTVTKTDTFDNYRIYLQRRANVLEALFDTPGSTTPRKINFVFNVRPNNEGGYIKMEGLNYVLQGEYENTDSLKSLEIECKLGTKVIGSFEVSVEKEVDGVETHFIPSLAISLDPDKFTYMGKLIYSKQDDNEEGLQAYLEGEGLWQKVEGGRENTEAFGEVEASFVANRKKVGVHSSAKYGRDRTDPHTTELSLDYSEGKGYVTAKASQVDTSAGLIFEYAPGHTQLTTNVSVQDTQVTSEIIVKNLAEGENTDFHMKASFESEQLDLNYIAEVLYKRSDEGFQTETELKIGSSLHSRFMLTYLWEDLNHLAGVHVTLNEFVAELGHSLDFSQPNKAHAMISGLAGDLAGGIHASVDYDTENPLMASLDIYAQKNEDLVMGVALSLNSDSEWGNFTGRTNIKWYDWSFGLNQSLILDGNTAEVQIGQNDGPKAKIIARTSPGYLFQFSVWSEPELEHPDFEFGIENIADDSDRMFNVNLNTGPDTLFQYTFQLDSVNKFNSSLRLLESQLVVDGQYDLTQGFISSSSFNGSAKATVILPGGETLTSNLILGHTLEDDQHTLMASASIDGDKMEGQLTYKSHDGWFNEHLRHLNLTVTTPFEHIAKFGFAFSVSSDTSELNFAEIFMDDIKIRGEMMLGDPTNMGANLEYTAAELCTSRLFFNHQEQMNGLLYTSKAGLILTDSHTWELALNTTLKNPYGTEGIVTNLQLETPVLSAPFIFHAGYNLTQDQFGIELRTGVGENELSTLVSGRLEWTWQRHMLHALAKFKSPWTEPMSLNATYDHTNEKIGTNLDFESSFEYFPSWVAEFSSNYANPEDWKTYLYLDYKDLQVRAAFIQNKTLGGIVQEMDASLNTFSMVYKLDLEKDRYSEDAKLKGRFTVSNLFDHNMALTFEHTTEMRTYITKASGTFDDHTFDIDYTWSFEDYRKRSDSLEMSLSGDVGTTKAKLIFMFDWDYPSCNSTVEFTSQWTKDYNAKFTTTKNNTIIINWDMEYGDDTIFSARIETAPLLNLEYEADTQLHISSSFFDDLQVKWKHDFVSGTLVLGEVEYGKEFYLLAHSDLKLDDDGWGSPKFKSYDINFMTNITSLDVRTKVSASAKADWDGEVELKYNEYFLQATSTLFEDREAEIVARDEANEYRAKFKIELADELPSASFIVTKNGNILVTLKANVESTTPKIEVLTMLDLYGDNNSTWQTGQLKVKVDISERKAFKGSANLESNLGGLEGLEGKLDLELKLENLLAWSGDIYGELKIPDKTYKLGVNSSMEVTDEFSFEYGTRFEILEGDQTQNLKDFVLIASMTSDAEFLGKITLVLDHTMPPKSVGFNYKARYGEFKGFLMLGDGTKYELSSRLSSRTLDINAKGIDAEDTKFQYLQGNIGWLAGRSKLILTLNMNSDFEVIKKMSGNVVVQKKRDLAITAKLVVNDEVFTGNLKVHPTGSGSRYRVELKLDNKIHSPFMTDIIFDLSLLRRGIELKSKIDLNDVKDWFEGNLKFTLAESYLKLRTPFDEFKSFNLTVTTASDEVYGGSLVIQAPQFCTEFSGELSKEYLKAELTTDFRLNCSGDPLFLFSFKYDLISNPIIIYSGLEIPQLIDPVKLNITVDYESDMVDIQAETEFAKLSYGVSVSGKRMEEEGSLILRYYLPPSNETIFIVKNSLSPSRFEAGVELPSNDQAITLLADYNFIKLPKLNATFHSNILDYEMKANFDFTIKNTFDAVVKYSMESDFVNGSLVLTYTEPQDDFKELTFDLKTPKGDAEGSLTYVKDENFMRFNSKMTSSLHSFEKYSFELVLQNTPVKRITIKSSQDHIEMEFNGVMNVTDNLALMGTLTTTLPGYERLDIEWNQPIKRQQNMQNVGKVSAMLAGQKYELEGKHSISENFYEFAFGTTTSSNNTYAGRIVSHHHGNPNKKKIEIFFTVPHFEPEDVNILLAYDLMDKSANVFFNSPRGVVGVNGTWDYERQRYFAASTSFYLSFFDLGSYTIDFSLPLLNQYEDTSIKITGLHPDVNFMSHLFISGDFNTGNLTFVINSTSDPESKVYSISYINQQFFTIEVNFDTWYAFTKLILRGRQILLSSASFEWKSNIPGYEALEGSWDFDENNRIYYGQLRVTVQRWGEVVAAISLDLQQSPYYSPWKKAKFSGQFESPFTSSHRFHLEYDLEAFTLRLYYQHGPDSFQVQWNARFDRRASTFALDGNVPIKGFSTFSIFFNTDFDQAYRASFEAMIEDSALEASMDISPDWLTGNVKYSLKSPFMRPSKAKFDWSLVQSPLTFKAIVSAGDYAVELKTYVHNTWNSLDFEWQISTKLEETQDALSIKLSYRLPGYGKFDGMFVAKLNDHFLKIKSSIHNDPESFLIKFAGIGSILDVKGSLEVDINNSEKGVFKGTITGELPKLGQVYTTFLWDSDHIRLSGKHQAREVLSINISKAETKVQLKWTEYWAFTLVMTQKTEQRQYNFNLNFSGFDWQPTVLDLTFIPGRKKELKLTLESPLVPPVDLHITFTSGGNNKFTSNLKVGETTYELDGQASLRLRRSRIDLELKSSEDPDNPMELTAQYNIRQFLVGRMRSEEELASLVFEWGEKFEVTVTGLRDKGRIKLDAVVSTPSKDLPTLLMGYDGTLNLRESSVDFTCSAYVNGTYDVTLSGHTKLSDRIDIEWTIKTSYPNLKEISSSILLMPGNLKISFKLDEQLWAADLKYNLNPHFSLTCDFETPITNYETFSLLVSSDFRNDKFIGKFEFSWPEEQQISLNVQIEKWKLGVNLETPWEPFKVSSIEFSLTTESERLKVFGEIKWDDHEIETNLSFDPQNIQLMTEYLIDRERISQLKFMGKVQRLGTPQISIESSVELELPFEILKSLSATLAIELNEIMAKLEINDVVNEIEMKRFPYGAEMRADIPILGNFKFSLKAEEYWRKLESELSFSLPQMTSQVTTTLNYEFEASLSFKVSDNEREFFSVVAEDGREPKLHVHILGNHLELKQTDNTVGLKIKTEHLYLEEFSIIMETKINPGESVEFTYRIKSKLRNQNSLRHKLHVTVGREDSNTLINMKLEGDLIVLPYTARLSIPRNLLDDDDAELKIEIDEGDEELLVLRYQIDLRDRNWIVHSILTIGFRNKQAKLHVKLRWYEILAELYYPGPDVLHSLNIYYTPTYDSKHDFGLIFDSPALPRTPLKYNIKYAETRDYQNNVLQNAILDLTYAEGPYEMKMENEIKYDQWQQTFEITSKFDSDLTGRYFIEARGDWSTDMTFSATLRTPQDEHTAYVEISPSSYAMEVSLSSPWLPGGDIRFTGDVNTNYYNTNWVLKTELLAGERKLKIEAEYQNIADQEWKVNVLVDLDGSQVVSLNVALSTLPGLYSLEIDLLSDIFSLLNTYVNLKYELQYTGKLDLSADFSNVYLLGDDDGSISLSITSMGNEWLDLHRLSFKTPGYEFRIESELRKIFGNLKFVSPYNEVYFTFSKDLYRENDINIELKTSIELFEILSFNVRYSDEFVIKLLYIIDGQPFSYEIKLSNDIIFGKTLRITLRGPDGKLELITPRYVPNRYLGALLQIYDYKIGGELSFDDRNYPDIYSVFSLYLPFEKYEAISLRFIFLLGYEHTIEARVGKLGFTLSLTQERFYNGQIIELLARLNEREIRVFVSPENVLNKVFRGRFKVSTSPEPIYGIESINMKFKYRVYDHIMLRIHQNNEQISNFLLNWGSSPAFRLLTPKIYPGYVHINFVPRHYLNEYKLEVGFLDEMDSWFKYNFHFQQYVTSDGRKASMYLDIFGIHLGISSKLWIGGNFISGYFFSNGLLFELNDNRIGYTASAGIDPGLLSNDYNVVLQLHATNRTVYYDGYASKSCRHLDVIHKFTWNELDELMPPVLLTLNYVDYSLFGHQLHHMKVKFTHPDVKDIILQGNLTGPLDSEMNGMAEFIDENSPDMKVVMSLNMPLTETEEQQAIFNISQPSSGFGVTLDTRVMEMENDMNGYEMKKLKVDNLIKYWSMSDEMWQEMNISTSLGHINNGYDFSGSVDTSDGWGYSWDGHALNQPSLTSLNIKGTSRVPENFWSFTTKVNKFVPEFQALLQTGHDDDDGAVYEAGRVRLGLHSPVAAGAMIEHQKFGHWRQDASIGVMLNCPFVLKFYATLDPLVQQNNISWTRLFSPGPQVYGSMLRDSLIFAAQVNKWAQKEGPVILDVLKQNGSMVTVWQRVESNWVYLLEDLDMTVTGIKEDLEQMWEEHILPALTQVYNFIMMVYELLVTYLNNLANWMTETYKEVLQYLEATWTQINEQYLVPAIKWFGEATGGVVGQAWEEVVQFFTNLFSDLATKFSELFTYIQTLVLGLVESVKEKWNELSGVIQGYVSTIQSAIGPYFDNVMQAVTSYRDEVLKALDENCLQLLVEKFTALTTVQDGVGKAMKVLSEFFQGEEYLSRFNVVKDKITEWGKNAWGVIEGWGMTFLDTAVSTWKSLSESVVQFFNNLYNTLTETFTEIQTNGFLSVLTSKATELQTAISEASTYLLDQLKALGEKIKMYITENPLYMKAKENLGDVYESLKAVWDKWSSSDRTDLSVIEKILFPAADIIYKIMDSLISLDLLYKFKYSTHGLIEYNQYYPGDWCSFFEPPRWHPFFSPSTVEQLLEYELGKTSCLWKLHGVPNSFLPPFFATATISGQHITTFDKHHSQFLGSCSYLLAKDFVGKEFEVIGIYESGNMGEREGVAGLEAVVVHGPRIDVTLYLSGAVSNPGMQSGAKVYTLEKASVLVLPDLVVSCSNLTQSCAFAVSPKYFNRLDGLLGNFNNDPSDDNEGPGGSPETQDPAVLARLWAISPSPCYQSNQANFDYEPERGREFQFICNVFNFSLQANQANFDYKPEDVKLCKDTFIQSSSPLSPCFSLVDPIPYFNDCIVGRRHPTRSPRDPKPPCSSVSAYLTQCRARGLRLPTLKDCQTSTSTNGCTVNDMEVSTGWNKIFKRDIYEQGKADVVILVETAECNKDYDVRKIVTDLTIHLHRQRISSDNIRYSLVTVPGGGTERSVNLGRFTTDDQVVGDINDITYTGTPASHHDTTTAIISAATDLQWRPIASRIIVHVGCEWCGVEEWEGMSVLAALHQNDIIYHFMTNFNVTFTGTRREIEERERKMFGFDKDFVYTARDHTDFQGNERMRWALSEPDGVCVNAALASGGSVFSTDKWTPAKKTQTKKLVSVFSQRIAKSAVLPDCQECQCMKSGILQCQRCFTEPQFYIPHSSTSVNETPEVESDSIATMIKNNHREQFINNNDGFKALTELL